MRLVLGPMTASDAVSQRVYNDLVSNGVLPTSVTCGRLAAEVGATTYRETPGLSGPGATKRVTVVQGSTVSSRTHE